MIPAAFDYVRVSSLAQAIDLLQRDPETTKVVAGGHTLIPTLKLRLATPALLVDIRGVEELKGIRTRVRARKPQRATLASWSFAQLRSFVGYKAKMAGVRVVFVDPRNTSREKPAAPSTSLRPVCTCASPTPPPCARRR